MININRLHQLEKEADTLKDNIIKQSWLVHHIIGRDAKSDCGDVLIDIDRVYDMIDEDTNIPYIVIMSHDFVRESRDVYKLYQGTVFIKKELFDMTEEELRANKERLSNELEETNKIQRNARLNTMIAYDSMCRLRENGECNE